MGADTWFYLRDASGAILAEYKNSSANLDYVNLMAGGSETIGQSRLESGIWKRYYYIKDHLGNIRQTLRDDGTKATVVSTEDYYPFGASLRSSTTQLPALDKFKYQGKERDLETGYDYFEARLYDPQLGRFMQVDPHAEKYVTMNPFVGMGNNPLRVIDPTGMDWYEYEDENGKKSAFWHEGNGKSIDVNGTTYKNVGTKYKATNKEGTISMTFNQNQLNTVEEIVLKSANWQTQEPKKCYDAAKKIAETSGSIILGSDKTLVTGIESGKSGDYSVVATDKSQDGINLINSAIDAGKSTVVGVDRAFGLGYNEGTTDHFVAISSRITNVITKETSFSFFEVGATKREMGTSATNIFRINSNGLLVGSPAYNPMFSYTVTQVRQFK